MPERVVLAGVVVVALVAGPAVVAAAASTHPSGNAAGQAVARHALLQRSDLGAGWSASPPPRLTPNLTCPGFSPSLPGARKVGAVVSPTFSESSTGPFVSQAAYAFQSIPQAALVWSRVARRGFLRCAADGFTRGSAHGIVFTVVRRQVLPPPRVGLRAAAYRIQGTATTTGQAVDAYLDELVLAAGRVVTTVSITNLYNPVDPSEELRVARAVARRVAQS